MTEGKMGHSARICRALVAVFAGLSSAAHGQTADADLAQELTSPLASLMTLPVQMNFDRRIGTADDGSKIAANVQPVVPFMLSENWNLISRTIVPIAYPSDVVPGAGSQFGLGDVNVTLFLCRPGWQAPEV
jgi:hypothetical protein